ncbi:MAG: multiheme c-type cytochrome [Myxococcota bacterium]
MPRVLIAIAIALSLAACQNRAPEPRPVERAPSSAVEPAAGPARVDSGAPREGTLLLMADIRGVLKPCGCTLELQKGGFDRLGPFIAAERSQHPGARLVHAGPLFFEEAKVETHKAAQRERQAEIAADLMKAVDFALTGATAVDVAASHGKLTALAERAKVRLTAANLKLKEGAGAVAPWVIEEVGTLRVGVFALASTDDADEVKAYATLEDPAEAARRAVAALAPKSDVIVLLSALGLRETKRLVRAVPGIQFAIAGGLGEHPVVSDEAELVEGEASSTRVMQFHREGRYVGRLTVRVVGGSTDFVDASAPSQAELAALDGRIGQLETALESWAKTRDEEDRDVRSARHHLASLKAERERLGARAANAPTDKSTFSFRATPIAWDLPQNADALAIMDAFDEELARINLEHAGKLPEPEPGQAVYVGVDRCLGCHEEAKAFWAADRHHKAWKTLVDQKKTFDAECVSCHVTGYGKAGGSILGKTAGREDVQCEACHGPGSKHAESEDAADIQAHPKSDVCVDCHNAHHSPSFDFARYKPKLMVPGHGKPLP